MTGTPAGDEANELEELKGAVSQGEADDDGMRRRGEPLKNAEGRTGPAGITVRQVVLIVGALLVCIELVLLVTGYRVLVSQRHNPEVPVSRFSLGEEESYDCAYFTGRKIVRERLWAYDYDECPFIWTYR